MAVKLALCGDIFPANSHYTIGFGVASRFAAHGRTPWMAAGRRLLRDADVAFANLEAPLSGSPRECSAECFTGPEEFGSLLEGLGIRVVSVANNHILERGTEGFLSTVAALGRCGILHVGRSVGETSNIEVLAVNGTRIGFAAFSALPDDRNTGVYAGLNDAAVLRAVRTMESLGAERKIVSIHWGDEYVNIPARGQIESARRYVEAGVDIVLGHHPHVVQPVERYRQGLIFYSMGNFIFDMAWSRNLRRGMVALVTLDGPADLQYRLIPTWLDETYVPVEENDSRLSEILKTGGERMADAIGVRARRYERYYHRLRRRNTLHQRVMMKLFLLRKWRSVSSRTWSLIGRRITTRIGLGRV